MIDADELDLLLASARNHGGDGRIVTVTVNACAYSCCGRGWRRRDGYEQTYSGWVDNLQLPSRLREGSFMLYSPGIGTLSYVVAALFCDTEDVSE